MPQNGKVSLEDKDAIKELTARYTFAVSDGDRDALAACFTEDAVFEGRATKRVGHAEICGLAEDRTSTHFPHYIVTNFIISARPGEPGACNVRTALLSYAFTPSGVTFQTSGSYEDIVVKVGGEWRFRYRLVKADRIV